MLAIPGVAAAQACNGAASFRHSSVRIGAGAQTTDGAKSYGAELAAGAAEGPFAGVSLSAVDYDGVSEGSTAFGINGGYSIALGKAKKVEVCPLVGFSMLKGPDVTEAGISLKTTGRDFGFGGSVGAIATSTPAFEFIPFVSALYSIEKLTIKTSGGGLSQSESASENYVELTTGAGFVVNRVLTIQPTISYPLNVDNAKASFGIAFGFNFGSSVGKKE